MRRILALVQWLTRVVSLFAVAACATALNGPSQNVTVTTDPPGAACTFRRDGQVVGIVNPTPGTLAVNRGHAALDVACTKDGYVSAQGSVGSKFLPTYIRQRHLRRPCRRGNRRQQWREQ